MGVSLDKILEHCERLRRRGQLERLVLAMLQVVWAPYVLWLGGWLVLRLWGGSWQLAIGPLAAVLLGAVIVAWRGGHWRLSRWQVIAAVDDRAGLQGRLMHASEAGDEVTLPERVLDVGPAPVLAGRHGIQVLAMCGLTLGLAWLPMVPPIGGHTSVAVTRVQAELEALLEEEAVDPTFEAAVRAELEVLARRAEGLSPQDFLVLDRVAAEISARRGSAAGGGGGAAGSARSDGEVAMADAAGAGRGGAAGLREQLRALRSGQHPPGAGASSATGAAEQEGGDKLDNARDAARRILAEGLTEGGRRQIEDRRAGGDGQGSGRSGGEGRGEGAGEGEGGGEGEGAGAGEGQGEGEGGSRTGGEGGSGGGQGSAFYLDEATLFASEPVPLGFAPGSGDPTVMLGTAPGAPGEAGAASAPAASSEMSEGNETQVWIKRARLRHRDAIETYFGRHD